MVDIVSLIIAIGGLLVGILSHIRHSECFGVKIDTRTPPITPTTLAIRDHSPAVLDINNSLDIDIDKSYQNTKPMDITGKRQIIKNRL